LIARCTESDTGPISRSSHPVFSVPTPCSPAIVPPIDRASARIASEAARARPRWSSSAASKTTVGCMLPSPACPTTPTTSPAPSETAPQPSMKSATRERGTATSSISRLPSRSSAGRAIRRAPSSRSASAGSSVECTTSAPASSHSRVSSAISSRAASPPLSDWASTSAWASRSRPACSRSSTARMQVRSMTSSMLGTRPLVTTRWTSSPVCAVVANPATRVVGAGGAGRRDSVASVMTPRVPSDPTNSRVRS
jgi:hypothetical protein